MEATRTDLIKKLNDLAYQMRYDILRLAGHAREGHCAPALSIVDIITALYGHRLRVDPQNPDWPDRDRFILSKGHACLALYVALHHAGFLDHDKLYTYLQSGTGLAGHPIRGGAPGIEVSSGSLGHGFSIGAGMALAAKLDKKNYHTFVIVGDGESNEGMIWETALGATKLKLDNLTVILDRNYYQCDGWSGDIINMDPMDEKWKSFGWEVRVCDGHDMGTLVNLLDEVPFVADKPSLILANTIKGKGIKFMQNSNDWHYNAPLDEELEQALAVLENANGTRCFD